MTKMLIPLCKDSTASYQPWSASNRTIASAKRPGDPVWEVVPWRTAAMRPVKIPQPKGSRGPVLPQASWQTWVESPRGWLRPTWTTSRSSAWFPSRKNIRPYPWPPRSLGGVMPYPPSGTGTSLTAIEITENLTSAPKSAKPTTLGGGNCISNLTPLMGLEVQEFPTDTDSDATLAGISGANENNSTFLGSR